MKSRDELLDWVTKRATSKEDVAHASKLIAAYVADHIREDRKERPERSLFESIFGEWPS